MAVSMGVVVGLIKALGANPEAITQAVDDWLDDHPEATTTVEDGSITEEKLASALAAIISGKYDKPSGGIPASDLADEYIEEPASEGTSGQVLTTDGDGGRYWKTVSGGGGAVDDVTIDGTSVVNGQGVAVIPNASESTRGAMSSSNATNVKQGTVATRAITPARQHESVFYGLSKLAGYDLKDGSDTVGTYPELSKSAISQMLNAPVSVSGSTPSITAKAGVRYVCGECSTLSITAPESGCIDVVFASGSTPTVLTVSSAKTGVSAIKWANGFDPTSLDANTTYEINILDGEFGVVGSWT